MTEEEKIYLNALNLAFSPYIEGVFKILSQIPSPKEAFFVSKEKLLSLNFKKETLLKFLQKREKIHPEKEWKKLERMKIRLITKEDKEYPPLLKKIQKPPLALYLKGKILSQDKKFLACVGTRWPSDYGKRVALELVGELSYYFSIVSGMARGIDSFCHKAALLRNNFTVAVLGNGLDITFPPENKKLKKEIEEKGTIISEFPLSTPPFQFNFPWRNRIIAGMSEGVLVIEAKEKSGALLTANIALEEGRDVFSVPGPIFSKTSKGTNKLIKEGAFLVERVSDVLIRFNLEEGMKKEKEIELRDENEKQIFKILKEKEASLEEISKKTGLEISEVTSKLILMEIEGKVKKIGEKYYLNF